LRTDFDTMRDMLRTAFERPDQKRTVPGAASLLREIGATGAYIHILSGSPEQLRGRIEEKLLLDGTRWDALTLKPNLSNLLRLRLRAVRDQLGYKLPALLAARVSLGQSAPEVLIGDDAESDAFIYALYADVLSGAVGDELLVEIMRKGRVYDDAVAEALRCARLLEPKDSVVRILIHLDRQSPPSDFASYGSRVVPFYNYLQAAFVLEEDRVLVPQAVVRVAVELVILHRFDGESLARSYLDLGRRGHLRGDGAPRIVSAYRDLLATAPVPGAEEIARMCENIASIAREFPTGPRPHTATEPTDYLAFANKHSRRGHTF
jgi:hypothetical protein